MKSPQPYPLEWPLGWARTNPGDRKDDMFMSERAPVGMAVGVRRIMDELRRMNVAESSVIISTDIQLRVDGSRIKRAGLVDPGVAVFWMKNDEQQLMAADIYRRTEGNLCAIAATLDAMRAIERHGGAQINKRAWSGFKALPSSTLPVFTTVQAAAVIARVAGFAAPVGLHNDVDELRTMMRVARAKSHPDKHGGNQENFLLVNECKRVLEDALGVTL